MASDPASHERPASSTARYLRIFVTGHIDIAAERAIDNALRGLVDSGTISGFCAQEPDDWLNRLAALGSDGYHGSPFSPGFQWRDMSSHGLAPPQFVRRPGSIAHPQIHDLVS